MMIFIKVKKSDEDISSWSEDAIWNHLKNKIYDSTLYNCFDISQYERNWKVAAFAVDSVGNQFFGERDDTK